MRLHPNNTDIEDYETIKDGYLVFKEKKSKDRYKVEFVPFFTSWVGQQIIDFSWFWSLVKGVPAFSLPVLEMQNKLKSMYPDIFNFNGIDKFKDDEQFQKIFGLLQDLMICAMEGKGTFNVSTETPEKKKLMEIYGVKKITKI